MKKRLRIYLLAPIFLMGVFFACETTEVDPNLGTSSVSANIDASIPFNSKTIDANLFVDGLDTLLEITATASDNSILVISVQGVQEGVYSANSQVIFKYLKSIGAGVTSSENSTNGLLTITSYNESKKKVSGTFSFATKSHTISSGKITSVVYN